MVGTNSPNIVEAEISHPHNSFSSFTKKEYASGFL
jgi:hypothetical protein